MIKRFFPMVLVAAILGFVLIPDVTLAASPFYKGKTIRLIVGMEPGGGYDLYARLVARHIGKYIEGNPTVIVDNMPGAGSLVSANYLYNVSKADGLTIGHFNGSLFMSQAFGQIEIKFDSKKYEYIGAGFKQRTVGFLSKACGIKSMDEWMASKTPVKIGTNPPGTSNNYTVPKILQATIGLPVQLISGYSGTVPIRLAIESGEVCGGFFAWDSIVLQFGPALKSGDVIPMIQAVPQAIEDLPNVPLPTDFAKTDEARQLIQAGIYDPALLSRPFVLPPGTPKERVQILRKAFQETLKDGQFITEAKKAKILIDLISGEELETAIAGIFKLDPALLDKLKALYK